MESKLKGIRDIFSRKIKSPGLFKTGLIVLIVMMSAGSARVWGQQDSLITNSGEVLLGRYNKPVFGHSSFTVNGKKQPLDANLYQAYKHKDTWFRSVRLSATVDPVWMECLEQGPINLYQYVAYGSAARVSPRNLPASHVVWLASKNRGPLLNVNGVMATEVQAKDNLHKLLLDQPDLAGELDNVPFSTRVVRGLIAAYNRKAAQKK